LIGRRRRSRRQGAATAADGPVRLVDLAYRLHLALLLHAPVLEPDFDLALGERQLARQLDAATARQVAVELEVLLQLERLVTRVRLTAAAPLRRVRTCARTTKPALKSSTDIYGSPQARLQPNSITLSSSLAGRRPASEPACELDSVMVPGF